jgi:serine/threonine protein kinase
MGVVLYEMATGRPAFTGSTSALIFDAIFNKAPTAPVRLNPEIRPKLEDIIHRLLEKDRDLRYQHASASTTASSPCPGSQTAARSSSRRPGRAGGCSG